MNPRELYARYRAAAARADLEPPEGAVHGGTAPGWKGGWGGGPEGARSTMRITSLTGAPVGLRGRGGKGGVQRGATSDRGIVHSLVQPEGISS